MALVGNIRDFSLSDFLSLVDRGYKTGCLHLERGDSVASLYFEKGKLLTAAMNGPEVRVTELLHRRGKLSPQQADQAMRAHHYNGSATLSEALVKHQFIAAPELQRILQDHIEETVYGLFNWPDGEFRFEQNQKPDPLAPIMPTPLSIDHLIMEGVRRIDEWGRIKDRVPSGNLVVRFIEQPLENVKRIQLSVEEWRVFARIDGVQTLSAIAEKTGMSEFTICRIVYGFLTAGIVEVVRKPRAATSERGNQEAPKVSKNLVSRIINRIRGL